MYKAVIVQSISLPTLRYGHELELKDLSACRTKQLVYQTVRGYHIRLGLSDRTSLQYVPNKCARFPVHFHHVTFPFHYVTSPFYYGNARECNVMERECNVMERECNISYLTMFFSRRGM